MSAIDDIFRVLRAEGRKAFVPFVTAGDPDLQFTAEVVRELSRRGATLCELGVPYSDPIADGPVIQASYTRALAHRVKLQDVLQTASTLSSEVQCPMVTMVSYAIVYRHGLQQYINDAQRAGLAGAIVPDLPLEEADQLAAICRDADFSLIQLVTPTTNRERAVRIAQQSSGFLYYVSVAGITGERRHLPPELIENVAWLRRQTDLPICIGFGISEPAQAQQLRDVADGVIVGSALVRRIAEVATRGRQNVLRDVGQFAQAMVEALG